MIFTKENCDIYVLPYCSSLVGNEFGKTNSSLKFHSLFHGLKKRKHNIEPLMCYWPGYNTSRPVKQHRKISFLNGLRVHEFNFRQQQFALPSLFPCSHYTDLAWQARPISYCTEECGSSHPFIKH